MSAVVERIREAVLEGRFVSVMETRPDFRAWYVRIYGKDAVLAVMLKRYEEMSAR